MPDDEVDSGYFFKPVKYNKMVVPVFGVFDIREGAQTGTLTLSRPPSGGKIGKNFTKDRATFVLAQPELVTIEGITRKQYKALADELAKPAPSGTGLRVYWPFTKHEMPVSDARRLLASNSVSAPKGP